MKDLPLFYAPEIARELRLPESELPHALKALRLGAGDELLLTDGAGTLYEAVVTATDKRSCYVELLRQEQWQKYWRGHFSVAIAPTKSIDRMEWTLEKMTELGLDEIILLRVEHSERKHINAERLERILISAMKQSQKALLPTLRCGLSLTELLEERTHACRMIAHCHQSLGQRKRIDEVFTAGSDALLLFGPEGDFTAEEVLQAEAAACQSITLGESRLRTETAALSGLQWLHCLELMNRNA